MVLIVFCSSAKAQLYLRANFGGDAMTGASEFYHFDRFPERIPGPPLLMGRFGGGWMLEAEAGCRISKNIETGVCLMQHSFSRAGSINYFELDSMNTITVEKVAQMSQTTRLGICGYYYFGHKKIQPFATLSAQVLMHPEFLKYYEVDTTPNISAAGPRYAVGEEWYSGGFSLGYSVGGGVTINRDARYSGFAKIKYTFQQWTPARMDHSVAYVNSISKREEDLQMENPGIRIPMNAIGFSVGITCLIGRTDPVESTPH